MIIAACHRLAAQRGGCATACLLYTSLMKTPRLTVVVACLFPLLLAGTACRAETDEEALVRLRAEIMEMVGDASCRNVVNCRVVGLGARPCGGPDEYIAYSIWRTMSDEFRNLVSEYNLIAEDVVHASETAGICVMLEEPAADCVNDHCVTVSPNR